MKEEPIVIDGGKAIDDRGSLSFVNEFDMSFAKRFYQVENHASGFVRAFHGHKKEAKWVYVVKGTILIKVISMDSFDYFKTPYGYSGLLKTFVLSASKPSILHIPKGYFNGFKTLTEDTIVQFFSSASLEESKGDDVRLAYDYFGKTVWEVEQR